ncbi:L,D-transpeptidase-like protein [Tahibacter aquaticus]|uniref:L,D-transpeptidase-like protein n=1 Tax=Tahibacter aquaticus TaxID=520092 RepID=A0A4R6YTM3_9GAMM|nr:murein L,D-transpeptidase catalytic domain family protein [Tahibacter aquaticus]TDR41575.1 L,D-transpeptidase-like protein [Tahibacter aquaticus]
MLKLRPILFIVITAGSIWHPALADRVDARSLSRAAPNADPRVVALAFDAMTCAIAQGFPTSRRLAVIDYSRPSTQRRLWVFDLNESALLHEEWVAHGRNSGENFARTFSNTAGSLATSLGLFQTRDAYEGQNGYSLRLSGLEPGVNDQAMSRAIVIHGAAYVNPDRLPSTGRLGRSWGCPAIRTAIAQPLINHLKDGQYVFAYYPDSQWLATSPYLRCASAHQQVFARAAR